MEIDVTTNEELVERLQHGLRDIDGTNLPDHSAPICISCADIRQAADAIKRLSSGGGWRPIESAPKDKSLVLLFAPTREYDGPQQVGCFLPPVEDGDKGAWWLADGRYQDTPTHWQPLPAPPGASSGNVASTAVEAARRLLADRRYDSAFMDGVTAGWNAAQADDPNAAIARIHEAHSRELREANDDLRQARALLAAPPSPKDET